MGGRGAGVIRQRKEPCARLEELNSGLVAKNVQKSVRDLRDDFAFGKYK